MRALFPALFFLLIILRTSVVIHGCVGFDLDNFEGTDFSMAFNRMFLNEVHMSSIVGNSLEEKSSIFFNHSIGYFSIWMWIVYCTLTVNMKI